MGKRLALFDWNGTLLDDMPAWYSAVRAIFDAFDAAPPTLGEFFEEQKSGSVMSMYERYGVVASRDELNVIYAAAYKKSMKHLALARGAREVLAELKRRGVVLGIVSAQIPELFTPLFDRMKIAHLFSYVKTGVSDKAACIAEIVASEQLPTGLACYAVGDTPSDIRAARNANVTAVAYLNGYVPRELFSHSGPYVEIRRFRELLDLIP